MSDDLCVPGERRCRAPPQRAARRRAAGGGPRLGRLAGTGGGRGGSGRGAGGARGGACAGVPGHQERSPAQGQAGREGRFGVELDQRRVPHPPARQRACPCGRCDRPRVSRRD